MNILNLFRSQAVAVSSPDVLVDYDDVLEGYRRAQERDERRIIDMRQKIEDLEGVEERVSSSILEMQRECDNRLYESDLANSRAKKVAATDAEEAVLKAERDVAEELRNAKEALAEVQSTHLIKQREIEQMVTMNDERGKLEIERKVVELAKEQQDAIQKVREEYSTKLEEIQKKQIEDGDKRFEAILARLPDTKVRLSGGVKEVG